VSGCPSRPEGAWCARRGSGPSARVDGRAGRVTSAGRRLGGSAHRRAGAGTRFLRGWPPSADARAMPLRFRRDLGALASCCRPHAESHGSLDVVEHSAHRALDPATSFLGRQRSSKKSGSPMSKETVRFFQSSDVARLASCTPAAVRAAVRAGVLAPTARTHSGGALFSSENVDAWLSKRRDRRKRARA